MPELVEPQQATGLALVGYLRVSTPDKRQDPLRQRDIIERWAATNGHQVLEWFIDEGTSGGTDPFQRPKVLQAIRYAEKNKANGLVVESVDRWTREGHERCVMSEFFLKLDHQLSLEVCDIPTQADRMTRSILRVVMAECAYEFRRRLREQVKSGIARAKAKGWPKGRPGRKPKPSLSDREKDLIRGMVFEEGKGVDKIALELSKLRGAWDCTDYKEQQYRRCGPTWLWHQIHATMPTTAAELSRRCKGGGLRKGQGKRPSSAGRRGQIRPFQNRYARDRLATLDNLVEFEQSGAT